MIAAGADPNASKEDAQSPYSPLMVAAGAGSVAVVRELLNGRGFTRLTFPRY